MSGGDVTPPREDSCRPSRGGMVSGLVADRLVELELVTLELVGEELLGLGAEGVDVRLDDLHRALVTPLLDQLVLRILDAATVGVADLLEDRLQDLLLVLVEGLPLLLVDHDHVDPDHVAEIVAVSRDLVSLDSPVYDEKNASVVGDFIENDLYQSPENYASELNLKDDLNKVLELLNIKERQVIEYRFGINGRRPMSLKEIGDRMHLTKERIRQIEKAALRKISVPEVMEKLEAYVA